MSTQSRGHATLPPHFMNLLAIQQMRSRIFSNTEDRSLPFLRRAPGAICGSLAAALHNQQIPLRVHSPIRR
jgi:hypothetical protein